LYPQKCDLSPDGRWLGYSALKYGMTWPAGSVYEAISRLPWLKALAAWEVGTTYTRGFHFDTESLSNGLGSPDVGDVSPCLNRYGLTITGAEQFSVERRRGWVESPDTPDRDPNDAWDERRDVEMQKPQPGREPHFMLHVDGSFAGHRSSPDWRGPASYSLTDPRSQDLLPLSDVQWADWDSLGRLIVATTGGILEARVIVDGSTRTVFSHDLSGIAPDPTPAPPWAAVW
jgi:hypothetical protein